MHIEYFNQPYSTKTNLRFRFTVETSKNHNDCIKVQVNQQINSDQLNSYLMERVNILGIIFTLS